MVDKPSSATAFPGFYVSRLKARCWASDSKSLVHATLHTRPRQYYSSHTLRSTSPQLVNTLWRSQFRAVRVLIDSGDMQDVDYLVPSGPGARTGKPDTLPAGQGVSHFFMASCGDSAAPPLLVVTAPNLPDTFQIAGIVEPAPPPHNKVPC